MNTYSDQIARVSTALSDPTRREIMELLIFSEGPLSVREVAEHFGLHVNAARMHLDKLLKGGLLRVIRSRGSRGGRPAYLYMVSDEDWELHLPPRQYKLLAEILARGISPFEEEMSQLVEHEAFRRGREEGARNSSPLAFLEPGAGAAEVAQAWMEELKRRGMKASWETVSGGEIEATFISCPFGEISGDHPGLICVIHRFLEEGFLSLAGDWRLTASDENRCRFTLEPGAAQDMMHKVAERRSRPV